MYEKLLAFETWGMEYLKGHDDVVSVSNSYLADFELDNIFDT